MYQQLNVEAHNCDGQSVVVSMKALVLRSGAICCIKWRATRQVCKGNDSRAKGSMFECSKVDLSRTHTPDERLALMHNRSSTVHRCTR